MRENVYTPINGGFACDLTIHFLYFDPHSQDPFEIYVYFIKKIVNIQRRSTAGRQWLVRYKRLFIPRSIFLSGRLKEGGIKSRHANCPPYSQ